MAAPFGNKYALGITDTGRPPVFETPDQFEAKAKEYIKLSIEHSEKITITGLALFMGFESRQSLFDYGKKQDFSYVVKRAKLAVENSYEGNGQTIDIFALKNMGWVDRQEVDQTIKVNTFDVGFGDNNKG